MNENEPKPEGKPSKPKFLKGRASKLWDEYIPALNNTRITTFVDAHMFAALCSLMAEFEKNPKEMTASRISQMRGLASSFGMDPSSRSRLSVKDGGESTSDPADKYFNSTTRGSSNKIC